MSLKKYPSWCIVLLIYIIIIIIFLLNEWAYGPYFYDFKLQHFRIVEGLRNYYLQTNVLFSNFIPEMGMGIPTSLLSYYGYSNPIIILLIFLKFIPVTLFFPLILCFSATLSTYSMYKILDELDSDIKYSLSIIYGFVPVLIYHSYYHPMFVSFLPFFTLSLYYMIKIIKFNKSHVQFIFLITLSYLMNITFSLQMLYYQLIFFFFLMYYLNPNKKLKLFIDFIILYLISLLVGVAFFYQQLPYMFSTGYDSAKVEILLFDIKGFLAMFSNGYMSRSGFFVILLIWGLFSNKKRFVFISSTLLLTMITPFIQYALTLFDYVHLKSLIYSNPLLYIYIGLIASKIKKSQLIILYVINLVFIYINVSKEYAYFMFMLSTVQFLYLYLKNYKFITVFIIIYLTLFNTGTINNYDSKAPLVSTCGDSNNVEVVLYETNVLCANKINPLSYLSVNSKYYLNLFNDYLPVDRVNKAINVTKQVFNNKIMKNLFFVGDQSNNVFNLVLKDDTFDDSLLDEANKDDRLYMIYQNVYTENAQKINNEGFNNGEVIYEWSGEFNPTDLNYNVTEVLNSEEFKKNNVYSLKYVFVNNSDKEFTVKLNNKTSELFNQGYGKETTGYINFDAESITDESSVVFSSDPGHTLKEIKVTKFNVKKQKMYEYKKVDNFKLIHGKGYSFDYNTDDIYILNSIVPFDKNFNIKLDGKIIEKKLINKAFLGAELPAGKHSVEITYKMKFSGLFMFISISTISILIIYLYLENKGIKVFRFLKKFMKIIIRG